MEDKEITKKLPIGIVIHDHSNGGSLVLSKILAQSIGGKLILLSSKGSVAGNVDTLRLKVFKIFGKRIFVSIKSLRDINRKISLWHIHYASPILFPLFFISKKPKIITFHYMFSESPFLLSKTGFFSRILNVLIFTPLNLFILNSYLILCNKFTFITNAQMQNFRGNIFFKKTFDKKSIVVPNFIGKELIKEENSNKTYNSDVLFVGNYTPLKGFNDLIVLAKQLPDVNFSSIGNDEFKSSLANLKNLGKVQNTEIPKKYDEHSIFILPSYTEVFPMTILEAMARGLVILVSDIPGMREIIEEGRNGYFFPAGNIQKIKERILFLKNNPQEIRRISKNNIQDIQKFTTGIQVEKYFNIYNSFLNLS